MKKGFKISNHLEGSSGKELQINHYIERDGKEVGIIKIQTADTLLIFGFETAIKHFLKHKNKSLNAETHKNLP